MKKTVDFRVAFGAVKHFGKNLYTTNPPAIAELVANCWDAYAKVCSIFYDDEHCSLLVADNGVGMTDSEFENRYAVSGMEKNTDIRKPNDMEPRPYMGKKGIGKFSVFSLGNSYTIYTKSSDEQKWKKATLEYDNLMIDQASIKIDVEYIDDLDELKEFFNIDTNKFNQGTLIFIPVMSRKFTKATYGSLASILGRRFSTSLSSAYNFKLLINSEEVNLQKHFYDESVEFVYYFGLNKADLEKRFSNISNKSFIREIPLDYFTQNNVSGWIGSVSKTSSLKIEDEFNASGIVVYINGKLADENILKSTQNSAVSNLYLVGEVDADFLQSDKIDPVLSSREGLNLELENVRTLRTELNEIRKGLINQWNELRASRDEDKQDYLEAIFETPEYKQIYDDYNESEKMKFKKYSQKLFDSKPENIRLKDTFTPFLFTVINSESMGKIQIDTDEENDSIINKFMELFDKSELNDALRLKLVLQDRLSVIKELRKQISLQAKEKVFEKHIAANPWLINPYWDRKRYVDITTQEKYEILLGNQEKVIGLSDLIIHASEEKVPKIVELKREVKTAYSAPSGQKIVDQISTYRAGIIEILQSKSPHEFGSLSMYSIDAFLIIGTRASSDLKSFEIERLENEKVQIITYDEIIDNAYRLYHDSFEIIEKK